MVSEFILPIAVAVLAAAGAFSAFLGWSRSDEPFNARKFTNGVITGVLAGIALVIANSTGILEAVSDSAAFILIASLALSIIGVDTVRTAVSSAIARRANPELKSTR